MHAASEGATQGPPVGGDGGDDRADDLLGDRAELGLKDRSKLSGNGLPGAFKRNFLLDSHKLLVESFG